MRKVLIIEDNAPIRENTAELLELENYKVYVAENGRIGFEMAQRHKPDLILCDMMMPETDGKKFLEMAKKDPVLKHVPLIFFSAGSPTPALKKALIGQADGFLSKPFLEEELLELIKNIIKCRT